MFKKDSTNSSNSSGTFEVDAFKAIRSLHERVTALEKSEKSTDDFVEKILDHIVIAISEVCVRLESSSNSKDIEQYSRSILYLSNSFRNLIQSKPEE